MRILEKELRAENDRFREVRFRTESSRGDGEGLDVLGVE